MSQVNDLPLFTTASRSNNTSSRSRKKRSQQPPARSNEDLIKEFIARKGVTVCPARYAEGAVLASGEYEF